MQYSVLKRINAKLHVSIQDNSFESKSILDSTEDHRSNALIMGFYDVQVYCICMLLTRESIFVHCKQLITLMFSHLFVEYSALYFEYSRFLRSVTVEICD